MCVCSWPRSGPCLSQLWQTIYVGQSWARPILLCGQELQVHSTRSCIIGRSFEEFNLESIENKEGKTYKTRSVFGKCDYYSCALIDVLCPYTVHRTVLIVFIDCFYSCWKQDRVQAEDEMDLWKCVAMDPKTAQEGGVSA